MKMKRIVLAGLAGVAALSLASCGGNNGNTTTTPTTTPTTTTPATGTTTGGDTTTTGKSIVVPTADLAYDYVDTEGLDGYYLESAQLYNKTFGKFAKTYADASQATSVSQKWALQAIAEAKLLETGAILPGESNGGNYGLSRVAYGTVSPVLWGMDNYKLHNALVVNKADGKIAIKVEDRNELKKLYLQHKGQGTYRAAAKAYLEGKGYTFANTITQGYTSDPLTFDTLADYHSATGQPLSFTFDYLYSYDNEETLKPALASSYVVGQDAAGKTTYTFTIRQGAKWVDKDGTDYANVTADDFVAGFQHMLDMGYFGELVEGLIDGVDDYDGTNFGTVGVKATDNNTLVYTFEEGADTSYFMSMLTYSTFAPLNRQYYESKGGTFGVNATKGTFGNGYDSILYCGTYRITQYSKENTIVFTKNDKFWNADNVAINSITWLFNDGSDATKNYKMFKNGEVVSTGLSASTKPLAVEDGYFNDFAYVSAPDAGTYPFWFNGNRKAYSNTSDTYPFNSNKNAAQKALAEKAMANPYFRLALATSIDRKAYYTASVGDESIALVSVLNSYTPANLVYLTENVTVKINGVDKTFEKGACYGEVMQAQLEADGYPMVVWKADPTADDGRGTGYNFDGWYNPEWANAFLNKAIEELAKDNVVISTTNPVVLELPYINTNSTSLLTNKAMAKSIEDAFGGKVIVNLVGVANAYCLYYAAYFNETGEELNVDISKISGWGPDYGDPKTYLDTFLNGQGGMAKNFGIY